MAVETEEVGILSTKKFKFDNEEDVEFVCLFVCWYLTPLSTIFQLYRGGQFCFGGGNKSTRRKPPNCRKSLTNFITYGCIKYTSPEWDPKSQGNDCIDCYKTNYHTITTTTVPSRSGYFKYK
jgi:hypothetical protein